jgi:hypothetical protein
VPSELYRYIIDTELQRSDDYIFCVSNFVFFRASLKKNKLIHERKL